MRTRHLLLRSGGSDTTNIQTSIIKQNLRVVHPSTTDLTPKHNSTTRLHHLTRSTPYPKPTHSSPPPKKHPPSTPPPPPPPPLRPPLHPQPPLQTLQIPKPKLHPPTPPPPRIPRRLRHHCLPPLFDRSCLPLDLARNRFTFPALTGRGRGRGRGRGWWGVRCPFHRGGISGRRDVGDGDGGWIFRLAGRFLLDGPLGRRTRGRSGCFLCRSPS